MIDISNEMASRGIETPSRQGSVLDRIGEEALNRDIDHLWKLMVKKHPIDEATGKRLKSVAQEVSDEVTHKDVDIYWSRIVERESDPFYRMLILSSIEQNQLGYSPKQILQAYLDMVSAKHQSAGQTDQKTWAGTTLFMDEFIGPADLVALAKDPVNDVCNPEAYGKRVPNCIQVSTVFSRIFSSLGHRAAPVRYSKGLTPHVGIMLMDDNMVLRYGQNDVNGNIRSIVKVTGLSAFNRWQAPGK